MCVWGVCVGGGPGTCLVGWDVEVVGWCIKMVMDVKMRLRGC